MPEIAIRLPKLTEPQKKVAQSAARFRVVNCGRRFGKTFFAVRLAVKEVINGGMVGWFAPNYKYADEPFFFASRLLAPVARNTNRTQKRIEVVTGGIMDVWSLDNEDAGRGRKYSMVVVDEAAIVKNLERSWSYALRPTLSDLEGRALFLSTPKGLNFYHALYQRGVDGEPGWQSFQFPTSANPFIAPSEIDAARRDLPDRVFRQEYLAEFLTDGNYFANVTACATITEQEGPAEHNGHHISIGVDWALSNDYTVATAFCGNCNRVVGWERYNRIDTIRQIERVVNFYRHWNATIIVPERNSLGAPNVDILVSKGIRVYYSNGFGFNTSATTKPPLMQTLALALEQGSIAIPLEYRDELLAYEIHTGSFTPRFSAPTGMHDDRVMSLALAYHGALQSRQAQAWIAETRGKT